MTKLQKTYNTIEVGKRIKQLRKARSLKQDDLMEVLNLSRPAISNIETGRRNINLHQIKALADYFGVSIEVLGIQTEEVAIHKYDTENTRYGFRLVELYPHNSYLKHNKFNDIIMLLDQASGCDAYYEIDMDKELYDKLNALGQAVFSKPQTYTDEMLEETWNALSAAVDFEVK